MYKINPQEIKKESLINWLQKNRTKLSKQQIYDISHKYMRAVYLRNGNLHVYATLDMLKEYEDRGDE